MGYVSDWARARFSATADKNAFYRRVGEMTPPGKANLATMLGPEMAPQHVLATLQVAGGA